MLASAPGHLPSSWHTLGRDSASPTHCFHIPLLNICVKFIGSCITNMWTLNKCSKIQHVKNNMKLNWKTINRLLLTLAFSPPSYLHFALFVLAI